MDRLDRSALIVLAVVVTLGLGIWEVARAIGYSVGELLIDWWDGDEDFGAFTAEFNVGGVEVPYGQVLSSFISVLVVLAILLPLIKYAARRRSTSTPS